MKSIIVAALALIQVSAYATSRTPETYCVSVDGQVSVAVYSDRAEREADVSLFNGQAFEKVSGRSVSRRDVSQTINYLGRDFGLSVELSKSFKSGFKGNLYLSSTSYSEPVTMICSLSQM